MGVVEPPKIAHLDHPPLTAILLAAAALETSPSAENPSNMADSQRVPLQQQSQTLPLSQNAHDSNWQGSGGNGQSSSSTPATPTASGGAIHYRPYPSQQQQMYTHHHHQQQQHSQQQAMYNGNFGSSGMPAYRYVNGATPYPAGMQAAGAPGYSPYMAVQQTYQHPEQQMAVQGGYRQAPYGWTEYGGHPGGQGPLQMSAYPQGMHPAQHLPSMSYQQGARGSVSHSSGPSSASGSRSIHSPKASTGAARLQSFTFPHVQPVGAAGSLDTGGSVSGTASPAADSVALHTPSTSVSGALGGAGGFYGGPASQPQKQPQRGRPTRSYHQLAPSSSRSDVLHPFASHLPALSSLPCRPTPPPAIALLASEEDGNDAVEVEKLDTEDSEQAETLSHDIKMYIRSLEALLDAHGRRDQERHLREEALGFGLATSDLAGTSGGKASLENVEDETVQGDGKEKGRPSDETVPFAGANAIVGLRLLQRVQALQKENEELGEMLARRVGLEDSAEAAGMADQEEVKALQDELTDAHTLIQALSSALTSTKQRAAAAELALKVACEQTSRPVAEESSAGLKGLSGARSISLPQSSEQSRADQRLSVTTSSVSIPSINGAREHASNGSTAASTVIPATKTLPTEFPALPRSSPISPSAHNPASVKTTSTTGAANTSPSFSRPKNNPWGLGPK